MTLAELNNVTPNWVNWVIIVGGAAASWLAPFAALVAIVWGLMQMWTWLVNKQWRRKR